jgi:hypothetical protein
VLTHVPPGESRPLKAIEVAEAWCRGEASFEDVVAASDAARAASDAAWAASAAARAASAAARAASDAVWDAATAAVWATRAAAYAAADADVWAAAHEACARRVRKVIGFKHVTAVINGVKS